jgi:hypothetical protein
MKVWNRDKLNQRAEIKAVIKIENEIEIEIENLIKIEIERGKRKLNPINILVVQVVKRPLLTKLLKKLSHKFIIMRN